jgi:hypothetical protein
MCGDSWGTDKEALKGSTFQANGLKITLCCPCEDALLKKLAQRRNIGITYGYGGEIRKLDVASFCGDDILKLANGYKLEEL